MGDSVSEREAFEVLDAAVDAGITFIDTADVYGDGRSERFCGQALRRYPAARLVVATKMGLRAAEQRPESYNLANFLAWTDRSRRNLGVDPVDLVQLHVPPTAVYSTDAVFEALDELVASGRIRAYGVSVETCAQALAAIGRPGVATVQLILNCFRLKPLEEVLLAARRAGVGIIARVPLASGLLSGKYDKHTVFASDDLRTFNRHGEEFDVGETFAGVPFEVGLEAVRELSALVPPTVATAQFALRWIIDEPGVSVVIPGTRSAEQVRVNAASAGIPALSEEQLAGVRDIYDRRIRPHVHDRW